MDPIEDMFAAVRVQSICYGRLNGTAPWGLRFESAKYAIFGFAASGGGWLTVNGLQDAIRLTPGDFFLLAPGHGFTLADDPTSEVREFNDETREWLRQGIPIGGGGESSELICGKFVFGDTHVGLLRDLLPAVIHIPVHQAQASGFAKTIDLLTDEALGDSPASRLVMNRLADILFIQAMRAHVSSSDRAKTPWLRAIADQQIGGSLRSMHHGLDQPWTVATLASDIGMSRSAYALRFKELLGEGPLEYLTRWRMYRAAELLTDTETKLVDVARAVGYDSDSAFQRVFKRVHESSPGEYRRRRQRREEMPGVASMEHYNLTHEATA